MNLRKSLRRIRSESIHGCYNNEPLYSMEEVKKVKENNQGQIQPLKKVSQENVSLVMRQRRLGMEMISNFAMFQIASHFVQFQGISNPLFPVK